MGLCGASVDRDEGGVEVDKILTAVSWVLVVGWWLFLALLMTEF